MIRKRINENSLSSAEQLYQVFDAIINDRNQRVEGDPTPDDAYFEGTNEIKGGYSAILSENEIEETPMDSRSATKFFKLRFPKITKVQIDKGDQGMDYAADDDCYAAYVIFYVGDNMIEMTVSFTMEDLGDGTYKLDPYKCYFFNEVCTDKRMWKSDSHAISDFFM